MSKFEEAQGDLQELISVETDNEAGLWNKTGLCDARTDEDVYSLRLTKTELVAYRKAVIISSKALRIAAAVEKHLPELKELDRVGDLTNKDMAEVFEEHEKEILRHGRVDTAFEIGFKSAVALTKAANSRNVIKDILREIEG